MTRYLLNKGDFVYLFLAQNTSWLHTTFSRYTRTYILNRTKGNFYSTIQGINTLLESTEILNKSEIDMILSQVNSYLGLLGHHNNYRLRKRILQEKFSDIFWKYFSVDDEYKKIFKLWLNSKKCVAGMIGFTRVGEKESVGFFSPFLI
ncbi:hypothetical protein COY60_02965, partial [Candidatus Gracilibacteria bacterium CG_4_10_14_0_8_um_filter_38_28]